MSACLAAVLLVPAILPARGAPPDPLAWAATPALAPLVSRAAAAWAAPCGRPLVEDPRRAVITAAVASEWRFGADVQAVTIVTRSVGHRRAVILVNPRMEWSPPRLLAVLEHELGHALGLEHTATGLMAPAMDPDRLPRVTAADRLAVCRGGELPARGARGVEQRPVD